MLYPNFLIYPSPPFPFDNHKFIFLVCKSVHLYHFFLDPTYK